MCKKTCSILRRCKLWWSGAGDDRWELKWTNSFLFGNFDAAKKYHFKLLCSILMGEIHKCYCNTRFFFKVFFFCREYLERLAMHVANICSLSCLSCVLKVTTQRYLAHQAEAHPPESPRFRESQRYHLTPARWFLLDQSDPIWSNLQATKRPKSWDLTSEILGEKNAGSSPEQFWWVHM